MNMAWISDHYHLLIHLVGTILLVVSEGLALRKNPSSAKGIVDGVLKFLGRSDDNSTAQPKL